MSGKGDSFRKVDRDKWDIGYLRFNGYCNDSKCPKSTYCWRYTERWGRQNVSYIPVPQNYDDCTWYASAPCHHCNQTGSLRDWCKIQKKYIKTQCFLCKGTGRLVYESKKS